MNNIVIRFTETDCEMASEYVCHELEPKLDMSVSDRVLAWLGYVPRRYLADIEAAGLQLVSYTSPFRDWFLEPDRKRSDKPPEGVSDDIGVFEFVSAEEADKAVTVLGLAPIEEQGADAPSPLARPCKPKAHGMSTECVLGRGA